jgi:hypothetical protein
MAQETEAAVGAVRLSRIKGVDLRQNRRASRRLVDLDLSLWGPTSGGPDERRNNT